MSYKIETKNNIFACTFERGEYSSWETTTINISAISAEHAYSLIKQLHSKANDRYYKSKQEKLFTQ